MAKGRPLTYGSTFPRPGEDPDDAPVAFNIGGLDARDPEFPFVARVVALMAAAGVDTDDPAIISAAVKAGRARWEESQAEQVELSDPTPPPPVVRSARSGERQAWVYYARIGNRCKIGYSRNLRQRMEHINPEEILAIEPGDQRVEQRRHLQFGHLRCYGEWFNLEEPLVGHIAQLPRPAKPELREIALWWRRTTLEDWRRRPRTVG